MWPDAGGKRERVGRSEDGERGEEGRERRREGNSDEFVQSTLPVLYLLVSLVQMSAKRSFGAMQGNDDEDDDDGKSSLSRSGGKSSGGSAGLAAGGATGGKDDPLEFFKRPKKSHAPSEQSSSSAAGASSASDKEAMEAFIKSKDVPAAPATRSVRSCSFTLGCR